MGNGKSHSSYREGNGSIHKRVRPPLHFGEGGRRAHDHGNSLRALETRSKAVSWEIQ